MKSPFALLLLVFAVTGCGAQIRSPDTKAPVVKSPVADPQPPGEGDGNGSSPGWPGDAAPPSAPGASDPVDDGAPSDGTIPGDDSGSDDNSGPGDGSGSDDNSGPGNGSGDEPAPIPSLGSAKWIVTPEDHHAGAVEFAVDAPYGVEVTYALDRDDPRPCDLSFTLDDLRPGRHDLVLELRNPETGETKTLTHTWIQAPKPHK